MGATQFLETEQGRRLAYHKLEGRGPCVVFLGGLKSDMEGTKAIHLEDWARARGQAFCVLTIRVTGKVPAVLKRVRLATGMRMFWLRWMP